ncbi:zinc finger protein weckle-like isoform X2 [Eurosta solidaginis]|uniref:zinc finger protein weckle-like isoform X2 n=1 Tax=Eurosta solidaginis TaxID=178769 RepID=UPI00353159FB
MSNVQLKATAPWLMGNSVPLIEEWKKWCRLCAKANTNYINILSGECQQKAILTDSKYSTLAIVSAIEEFFHVQIKEDEKLSPLVCAECYHAVQSFIKFNENIRKVQQMYNDLLYDHEKANLNMQTLFEMYQLFRDETLFPYQSGNNSELPVEEVFITESSTTSKTAVKSTKFQIKHEKITDEIPTEECIRDTAKRDDFEDPFAEEFFQCELQTLLPPADEDAKTTPAANLKASTPANVEDDNSDGDPDYNMSMDTSDDEDDDEDNGSGENGRVATNRTTKNNESIESEEESTENNTATNTFKKEESKYICNICSQRFQRSGNYSVHMRKKHDIIICPQCPSSFENEENLKRHMKDHRMLFPCPHCDRKFQVKEYVAQHIKFVHDDERPFICETCGDAVRTKGQLKEHMLTHTDYSPFECKDCGKRFKQKQRLKRHAQIHGDKHICTECGKQLSTRATLNSHLLVHSDKMPHRCDYCGRLFKRAKTLKNHLIAHTGLRPYSCDFCDKTFSTGPSCRFHKKTMHPVELAALEASGVKTYTKNIPNLDVLRAVSRTAENLTPLASKQNGYATFDKSNIQQDNANKKPAEPAIPTGDT